MGVRGFLTQGRWEGVCFKIICGRSDENVWEICYARTWVLGRAKVINTIILPAIHSGVRSYDDNIIQSWIQKLNVPFREINTLDHNIKQTIMYVPSRMQRIRRIWLGTLTHISAHI